MNAIRIYPWLTWTWVLGLIARIQLGQQSGVLDIIEGICQSNLSSINEVCFSISIQYFR